jgi:hypothetical protein
MGIERRIKFTVEMKRMVFFLSYAWIFTYMYMHSEQDKLATKVYRKDIDTHTNRYLNWRSKLKHS